MNFEIDIDGLSDQRKSMLLAKVRGWEVQTWPNETMVSIRVPPNRKEIFDLYDSDNMAAAWQIHLWALNENAIRGEYAKWWLFGRRRPWMEVHVQRLLLDKILELAIEVGLVESPT